MTRRDAFRALFATGVGAVSAPFAYGAAYERHRFVRVEQDIAVSGLPPAVDGLRVGLDLGDDRLRYFIRQLSPHPRHAVPHVGQFEQRRIDDGVHHDGHSAPDEHGTTGLSNNKMGMWLFLGSE